MKKRAIPVRTSPNSGNIIRQYGAISALPSVAAEIRVAAFICSTPRSGVAAQHSTVASCGSSLVASVWKGKQLDSTTYFPSPKARVNTAKRREPAADQKTMKRTFVHCDRVSGRDKDCGRRRIKEQPSRHPTLTSAVARFSLLTLIIRVHKTPTATYIRIQGCAR